MNLDGIARPYVKAVFEIAKENGELALWLDCIEVASNLVVNREFQSFVYSPNTSKSEVVEMVMSVFKKGTPKSLQSFIEVLIDNNRLVAIPSLHAQLLKQVALDSKVRQAEVCVAKEIADSQLKNIAKALQKRYDCKVEVQLKIDAKVLGGVMITMDDDTVFDGTLATRLDKLEYLLAN